MQMNYRNKDVLMGAMIVAGYDEAGGGQVGASRMRWLTELAPERAATSRSNHC